MPLIVRLALPVFVMVTVSSAIAPTLTDLAARPDEGNPLVSGAMMAQKAKQFDDGLYAAIELAAQHGAGAFHGKAALLRNLLPELSRHEASTVRCGWRR